MLFISIRLVRIRVWRHGSCGIYVRDGHTASLFSLFAVEPSALYGGRKFYSQFVQPGVYYEVAVELFVGITVVRFVKTYIHIAQGDIADNFRHRFLYGQTILVVGT